MQRRAPRRSALAVTIFLLAIAPKGWTAPVGIAPPFGAADPMALCATFPVNVGTCDPHSEADPATGRMSMRAETTFKAIATTDNIFSVSHTIKKATSVTYAFTLHIDVMRWENAEFGEAFVRVGVSHRDCDCRAGLLVVPFNAGQPPHVNEDHVFKIVLTHPAGERLPAGTVDVSATLVAEISGGNPVTPARFTGETAYAAVTATAG